MAAVDSSSFPASPCPSAAAKPLTSVPVVETPKAAVASAGGVLNDENGGNDNVTNVFKDLNESRAELLARVQSLKKDLKDWRGRLDNQVQTYRQELGELRNSLNVEVEQLKNDFQDLRVSLKKQLDATAKLSDLIPSELLSTPDMKICQPSPSKENLCVELQIENASPSKPFPSIDSSNPITV